MTSTDSSASNNNNNNQNSSSTSETTLDTSSKVMATENESQALVEAQETKESVDTNNTSSSEASSSPSSSSPSSSSPTSSSNDTSTDKTQALEEKSPKDTKSNQKSHYSKKTSYNHNQNSVEHSPVAGTSSVQQSHQQFVNYYPAYIPRQGQASHNSVNAQAPPYTQLDAQQSWPQAMAAAAAMAAMSDPMAIAAYMNGPNGVQNGVPAPYPTANPADLSQQHYDQFSFGFTPAFGFGYAGNGSIDYAAIQAAQQGSTLNPQSNQWTPSTGSTPAANPANPSSSPANTTTSSTDLTSSVPATAASETSAANQTKWIQVMQDPLAIHEFNTFQQQQLSPGDMYVPQHHHHHQPHHNNYRSHHHYNRHQQQHMQPNPYQYQYTNPYQMQHYTSQYTNMPHNPMHHHYIHPNKTYTNYQKNNSHNDNTGANSHDNNNNSNKSNNLNNTESSKFDKSSQQQDDEAVDASSVERVSDEVNPTNTESKSESGSKSWASIVGVSNTSTTTSNSQVHLASTGSSPTPTQDPTNQLNDYSSYMKQPKNNYYNKNSSNYKQSNYETSNQQEFDLTNRSFPPISANSATTKAELNENIKKSSVKKVENYEQAYTNQNAQLISQNSKKQQQYNNYQRQQQQQFNLPVSKYTQNYQNGVVNYTFNQKYTNGSEPLPQRVEKPYNGDKSYKGDKDKGDKSDLSAYYYKRHQPTQPTLSSFLNILDKNKFDDSKTNPNSKSAGSIAATTTHQSTNNTALLGDSADELSQQAINLHIDPSQLTVYTNPSAYNPKEFNTSPKAARFFVIKSYSEDDIHRSIKYNIWCSTEHGNRRLDSAYFKGDGQVPVYLFFSVNGSGHFCGMAEMQSRVDYNKKTGVWSQDKWRGCFQVKWVYVKDVPNSLLRNIKLENNDNKPVTNSRDTQEIPYDKGRQVLKVFHTYNHSSSILDDFEHYERKQEEDKTILKVTQNFEQSSVTLQNNVEQFQSGESSEMDSADQKMDANKDETVQNSSQATTAVTNTTSSSVTSSPSTSSSSSTSSIDESKQQQTKTLEKPQNPQLISSSS